jgi:hypothetical protein
MKLPDVLIPYKIPLYIFLGVLFLMIAVWISNSYPRDSVMRNMLDRREKEIRLEYKEKMEENNKIIKGLEVKLQDSKKIEVGLQNEIKRLGIARGKIYEPTTRKETVDRFSSIGYPPNK